MDKFNVLDLAQSFDADDEDTESLFSNNIEKKDIVDNDVPEHYIFQKPKSKSESTPDMETKRKSAWSPDPSLIEDMPEMATTGAVYNADEVQLSEDRTLHNIADDTSIQNGRESMDSLTRIEANIEDAKKRHGISKFKIPQGPYHASITAAAGDTNYQRAQRALDEIFNEIKQLHPDFILEWVDNQEVKNEISNDNTNIEATTSETNDESDVEPDIDDVKVVLDKSQLSSVTWSAEEMDKIRKSRTVELNIVEMENLEYSQIEDAPDNIIDSLLMPYQYKVNCVDSPLPASKYRATFTGLPYPEVLDLYSAQDLDNIEGELKKWSIVFNHMRNQSIGPWREYKWYIDPDTKQRIEISILSSTIPTGLTEEDIHTVTKFDDFLMKTSFIDLEWMLWKVLCATAMEREIISIDCGGTYNGTKCDKTYDWVYSPSDLLVTDLIDPTILEEMKKTSEVMSNDDIISNYMTSMLKTNNVVKLNSSGLKVVFGHISAYEYLHYVYPKLKEIENLDKDDPTITSKTVNVSALTVVREFIVPKYENGVPTGKYYRVTGVDNLLKFINSLNEVDWQVLSNLVQLMLNPYRFRFALRDVVCPRCGHKSSIPIENMSDLLFLVARGLMSVNVRLKKN